MKKDFDVEINMEPGLPTDVESNIEYNVSRKLSIRGNQPKPA